MPASSVVILFDPAVAVGADGLPDLGLTLLDWVRIGPLIAVRVETAAFDTTMRSLAGFVCDSEQVEALRRMPAGLGPWRWDCYAQSFEFAAGEGWPPEVLEDESAA